MSHKAWQNAHATYESDARAKALGIDVISMDEGFAVVTMTVTAQMLSGHQSRHGGQLFSLADTAFTYACNSQGLVAVAFACTIDFLRPGFVGDTLATTAQARHQGKQTGVYDIKIVNQQRKTVALFRDRSHRIGGIITGEARCVKPLFVTRFVHQLVATAGHYQVFGLMIWLLSLCGNC